MYNHNIQYILIECTVAYTVLPKWEEIYCLLVARNWATMRNPNPNVLKDNINVYNAFLAAYKKFTTISWTPTRKICRAISCICQEISGTTVQEIKTRNCCHVRISCRKWPKEIVENYLIFKKLPKKRSDPKEFQKEIKGGWFWRERDSFPGYK